MKPVKKFLSLIIYLSLVLFNGSNIAVSQDIVVSGEVKTGFRILEVDPEKKEHSFTVYRGDYIKFQYPESFGELQFQMAALKYSGLLPPDPGRASFYKMKKVGTYGFTLGGWNGNIEVVDLVRPNYVELTAEEAAQLLAQRNLFILDVRIPKEYQQLHLKNSHLIPIQELQRRLGELENKKHEDIFVYCATGNRSTVAAKIMADSGFKRIYNLRHGIHDWARKGYPYETGK